ARFESDAVRDEKAKVLNAIRPFAPERLSEVAVRGQYGKGSSDGKPVPGYREEEDVANGSPTPTYAAMRFQVDNWRWEGVPFLLRSGKRLPHRVSEIAVQFREPPVLMFRHETRQQIAPNVLTLRIQPHEGASLSFQ